MLKKGDKEMRKIVGIIHPFDLYQNFYVYEDGNKIEATKAKMEDVPLTIIELSELYDAYNVGLSGASRFIKKIIQDTEKEEIAKYSEKKLCWELL